MTITFSVVIIVIALFFKDKKVFVPIVVNLLSILVIIISFIVGRWEGLGLGFIGLSIFLASIIALIFCGLIIYLSNNRKEARLLCTSLQLVQKLDVFFARSFIVKRRVY